MGVERSESTSSGSSGEESSKPRPKRVLRITVTESSLGPVREAGHGQDQHIGEERHSESDQQRKESSVCSDGAVSSVCVCVCACMRVCMRVSSASLSASPKPSCARTYLYYLPFGWVVTVIYLP